MTWLKLFRWNRWLRLWNLKIQLECPWQMSNPHWQLNRFMCTI
jgi:hypothetical protein